MSCLQTSLMIDFLFFMATSVVQIFYASRKSSNMSLSHLATYSEHEYIYTHTRSSDSVPRRADAAATVPLGPVPRHFPGKTQLGRGLLWYWGLAPLWSWKQFQFEHKLRKTWVYDPKILVLSLLNLCSLSLLPPRCCV